MAAANAQATQSEQAQPIAGYCTECFDLLWPRDQCWVLVPTRSSDLLRRLSGEPERGYRPVCKDCYQSLVGQPAAVEARIER